jgi:hypothetical protein
MKSFSAVLANPFAVLVIIYLVHGLHKRVWLRVYKIQLVKKLRANDKTNCHTFAQEM